MVVENNILNLDGERFLPWMKDPIINYEHLHRYAFAKELVKSKKVLDLACGEGYGSAMLAEEAEEVIGVDINESAIKHASTTYVKNNLMFVKSSITEVAISGHELFDVVVCFEALEHVEEQNETMKEVKRLLKNDGIFIVSMPNKRVYSDQESYKNPWHKKELYLEQFEVMLKDVFTNVSVYGQKVFPTSNIFSVSTGDNNNCSNSQELCIENAEGKFRFVAADKRVPRYFIAIASSCPVNAVSCSSYLMDITETSVYKKKTKHARKASLKSRIFSKLIKK